MYYKILGGITIQISDDYIEGYKEMFEEEIPEYNEETHYLAYEYKIIDDEVHKVYRVEEKIDEKEEEI